ncbi:copper resistance system multicopper oxidase [Alteraurantiacibacter aestuarii]|uniref:Copper resistance system multicopper oxidase n=2 Tax=Alteraurantiacibacter aestuarii TaxID=650004 RepID=A0A844ZJ74_9SPHN|nr:copper resistance system multicopper oxidase [Alteraurantiacibacter aestuarii]MXO87634.1 copper resistance system multicopper oxidase [Alteraurantiacibacter aestuarii]
MAPLISRRVSRRTLIRSTASLAALAGIPMAGWAQGMGAARKGSGELSGEDISLSIGDSHFATGGRQGHAIAVNGSIPGPLIRLREGQDVRLHVTNNLAEDSSIHWHGLLLPFQYDGVPGVSFPGIAPGQTFTYQFPIRQSGTYWWHSHSGLQEQSGHYGPIVIEPAHYHGPAHDREYVLLLSEFTPMHPHDIMRKLKVGEHYFNRQMLTATSGEMSGADRRMWGRMRMNPRDILDVSGSEYSYLINGHGPADDLELTFRRGERVRLRVINGSAMTFFNVRIPGAEMLVVAADGQDVDPVAVEEFQIGAAETYDVIVQPADGAHVLVAEAMDRSGMGVATLTSQPGARAPVPDLREPVTLTMADMGMGAMAGGSMAGMDHGEGSMDHSMRDLSLLPDSVATGPGVDMVAPMSADRMDYPGLGLDAVSHRVLRYTDLRAASANPMRAPERTLQIHLTGNMERYMWSFDGQQFTAVTDDPIRFGFDERVRVTLVNDTMMAHPIHLHGHFFELVNGADATHQPRKHTLIVQPGSKATFDLTANEPGDWAFHCHLLYHMHAGMMQVVTVRPLA